MMLLGSRRGRGFGSFSPQQRGTRHSPSSPPPTTTGTNAIEAQETGWGVE